MFFSLVFIFSVIEFLCLSTRSRRSIVLQRVKKLNPFFYLFFIYSKSPTNSDCLKLDVHKSSDPIKTILMLVNALQELNEQGHNMPSRHQLPVPLPSFASTFQSLLIYYLRRNLHAGLFAPLVSMFVWGRAPQQLQTAVSIT